MSCPENYKPSLTLLKSSLCTRGTEYPRVAALYGIAYVVNRSRPKAERFGWFICNVVSTIAMIGIIYTLMERFRTNPMMNSVELQFTDRRLDLPRFYFCPPWKSLKVMNPPKNYNTTLYEQLYTWDFVKYMPNKWTYLADDTISLQKFFKENAPLCNDFVRDLKYSEKEIDCSSIKMAPTTAGICFIIPSAGSFSDETSLTFTATVFPISFKTATRWRLVEGCIANSICSNWIYARIQVDRVNQIDIPAGQYPYAAIYATLAEDAVFIRHIVLHYLASPATVTLELEETYTSRAANVLTRSQRHCFFPGEQALYVKCVLDCKIAKSRKFCDCVPWFLAKDGIKECRISQYECLDKNSINIQDTSECHCRLPCNNTVLKNTEIELLLTNEPCTIKIRERSPIKFIRSVRFGWTDLFVSFGGIAGLFLGCSILSIIEFGYYFSLRTYCGAVLSAPKRRQNFTKINVLDAVHPGANLTRDQQSSFGPQKRRVTFYDYTN